MGVSGTLREWRHGQRPGQARPCVDDMGGSFESAECGARVSFYSSCWASLPGIQGDFVLSLPHIRRGHAGTISPHRPQPQDVRGWPPRRRPGEGQQGRFVWRVGYASLRVSASSGLHLHPGRVSSEDSICASQNKLVTLTPERARLLSPSGLFRASLCLSLCGAQ